MADQLQHAADAAVRRGWAAATSGQRRRFHCPTRWQGPRFVNRPRQTAVLLVLDSRAQQGCSGSGASGRATTAAHQALLSS